MKLAGFLMMVFFQACISGNAKKLNFSGEDVPLEEIFKVIKSQAGVLFFYDADLLQDAKPVTINWKDVTLEIALNEMFHGQPVTWILEGKTLTIIKKSAAAF